MEKKSFARRLILAASAGLALLIGAYCLPQVNPFFASRLEMTRGEARTLAENFLKQQGYDVSEFYCDALFAYDNSALDYFMGVFGVKPVIERGRDGQLPLSWWRFDYYRNVPRDQQQELFHARVSSQGELLAFLHTLPDSSSGDSVSATAALQMAQSALQNWPGVRFADFKLEQSNSARKPRRTDHRLIFSRTGPELGKSSEILEVHIAGTKLAGVIRWLRDPQDFVTASGVVGAANLLLNTASVIVLVIVLSVALVAFLRKYHEGEIGVRTGLWLGGIVFLAMLVFNLNIWSRFGFGANFGQISPLYSKFILLGLQIVFTYVIMAVMVLAAWTVGEQFTRAERPRLLAGVDSIFNRRWITQNIGREVPAGFAFGLILFGGMQLIIYLLVRQFGVSPRLSFTTISAFDSFLPFLSIAVFILTSALYDEIVFRLFLVSSLRRLLKSPARAIIVSGIMYGFFLIFFGETFALRPAPFALIPYITLGIAQGFIFWRYGLLASMTSGAVAYILHYVGPLLGSTDMFFIGSGIAGGALLLGWFIIGVVGAWRGEEFEFTPEDEPAHVRRIKERVRLQKELEIARRVQLHLLPKDNPQLSGFDIAGACLPALEVGGDYYDFVDLRDGKLGIAVGDVSGKGVPAAIYMTLTKGILQSHAEEDPSPKHVLSKVNHLMYRTIERSWYVSMFYAVLDSKRRVLKFARAGHNPAIVFSSGTSETRLLQTAGIGLGLEKGDLFSKTLVEGELQLSPGDTLVFYTDGFTEAMNSGQEELGSERFLDILHRFNNGSAAQLLQHAFDEVRKFAGDHPQHDDMTMVVLKAY